MQDTNPEAHRLRVELVAEHQHASLADLLCELHAFYNEGAAPPRQVVVEHLRQNLLAPGSAQRLLVASRSDGAVVGLAAFSLVYSLVEFAEDQRRHCQLKELYVRSAERSQGAGRALMSGLARYALDHGCRRIDWPVKASNARGILFYESLGARRVAERLSYRLTEPALGRLVEESRSAGGRPALN
jgi:ribosomal protein S18 acetylase RimI-like enzyme